MCVFVDNLTLLTLLILFHLTVSNPPGGIGGPSFTRIITTRYGKLQGVIKKINENGISKHLKPIEMYLGVPYATSPTGANRFSPTRTPEPWDGIKFVNRVSPVCPQRLPDIADETEALGRMPRGRYEHLKRLLPHLRNQSEDCLYLNIYTPLQEVGQPLQKYPVLIYIHGESFEWNSGNPYDGRILASYADFVVITLNYRLGVLGFLNANAAPHMKARVANYGLMDQIAALHWVQQNIALFGGDPGNVTMMGHGTGAACINFLMISPTVMPGLFHKAVLLSGSALSSWALVEDPVHFAVQLASQLNCTVPDIHADHESLVDCLRDVPLSRLMAADTGAPSFLSAFGPSVDGVVIKSNFQQELLLNILPELQGYSAGSIALGTPINIKKNSEILLGGTNKYDLLFGVVTSEALSGFSNGDIEAGFEGERRDKIIRTYIRNTYVYHLSEIFFTVINEYTDWERTVLHPINTRDATIAAISDAQYVAPLVQIGDLLSRPQLLQSGGGAGNGTSGAPNPPSSPGHTKSYFYVFDYQTKDGDYPQRMGTAHGEELPYIFGAPLIDGFSHFPRNFTKSEVALSEAFILYLSNFARTGNPNEFQHRAEMTLAGSKEKNRFRSITWDEYDPVHQKYLEISMKPRMKNHYRAHQLSVWLRLIPELHRAGMEGEGGASARHNVFRAVEGAELYEGVVRSDPLTSGRRHVMTSQNGTVAEIIQQPIITSSIPSHQLTSCLNITQTSQHQQNLHPNYHELSNLDLSNFASYNTALTITITIGCSLLVLNILIFAGVYYQKDRNNSNKSSGKKDRSSRKNSMSNSNSSCYLDAATSKNLLNMDTSSIIVDIERDMMLTEDKQQHCDLMLSHPQTSNAASMKTLSHLATLPRNKHIMSDTQCVTSLNTQYNAMTSQPCCNNVATLPRNITFNPVMTYDCKMAQSTGADCNFRSSNVHESFRQSPNVLECSRSSYQGNTCDGGGAKNLIKLNSSTSSSTGSGGSNPPGGNLSEMRV